MQLLDYDIPQTPCNKPLTSEDNRKETKRLLIQRRTELDTIKLANEAEIRLRRMFQLE